MNLDLYIPFLLKFVNGKITSFNRKYFNIFTIWKYRDLFAKWQRDRAEEEIKKASVKTKKFSEAFCLFFLLTNRCLSRLSDFWGEIARFCTKLFIILESLFYLHLEQVLAVFWFQFLTCKQSGFPVFYWWLDFSWCLFRKNSQKRRI